jgi:hypothetical protein
MPVHRWDGEEGFLPDERINSANFIESGTGRPATRNSSAFQRQQVARIAPDGAAEELAIGFPHIPRNDRCGRDLDGDVIPGCEYRADSGVRERGFA